MIQVFGYIQLVHTRNTFLWMHYLLISNGIFLLKELDQKLILNGNESAIFICMIKRINRNIQLNNECSRDERNMKRIQFRLMNI